jgi:ABC-type nickel/cobalt efflux system permease component RcnA
VFSNPAQLKTMQEIITLLVFVVFSTMYLGAAIKWNHIVGFALIVAAAFFHLPRLAATAGTRASAAEKYPHHADHAGHDEHDYRCAAQQDPRLRERGSVT